MRRRGSTGCVLAGIIFRVLDKIKTILNSRDSLDLKLRIQNFRSNVDEFDFRSLPAVPLVHRRRESEAQAGRVAGC